MKIYTMSDIHGRFDVFMEMLEKIKFKDSDMLYIIGDVIDRGPKSVETLQYIMKQKNMVMLAGNHEYMAVLCLNNMLKEITQDVVDDIESGELIGCLEEWQMNGGEKTLKALLSLDKDSIVEIFNYLVKLKIYKELEVEDKKLS